MLRSVLRVVVRFLFALLAHVHALGLENIPSKGGAILAANHLGRLDSPLAFIMIPRDDLTGLVADKYKKSLFFSWLVNAVDGIWLNRDEADVQALRAARDFLRQGGLLGIAPEGTRSTLGVLMPAKTGVAYLADKARVPVMPVAIWGTERAFHELFRFHRPHLYIHFGEAFDLPPIERRERDAALHRNTDEIMCRIAAMLPDTYRGAYADHPRLHELLAYPQQEVLLKT